MREPQDTSVTTSIEVDVPIEQAFRTFLDIGSWWDEDKHLVREPLVEMVVEPWIGGRIIDRHEGGTECAWARVLAYEPPHRLCFSWDITTSWELEPDPARTSEVDVVFDSLPSGGSRVTLTHRHLDRHGDGWERMRDAVRSGWSLAGYARAAARDGVDSLGRRSSSGSRFLTRP